MAARFVCMGVPTSKGTFFPEGRGGSWIMMLWILSKPAHMILGDCGGTIVVWYLWEGVAPNRIVKCRVWADTSFQASF